MNYFFLVFFLVSCSSAPKKRYYQYEDQTGQYQLQSELGKKNGLPYKKTLLLNKKHDVLEKTISVSDRKNFNPKVSQYTAWFDGKKYFSQILKENKNYKITISPKVEKTQNDIKLPNKTLPVCFFEQIVSCVNNKKFFKKAMKNGHGQFSFYVIWEKYPFLSFQLNNFPQDPFGEAQLTYDGKYQKNVHRFSLQVSNQTITYLINNNYSLEKRVWVNQGINQIRVR